MKVLGIDPGYEKVGIAILEEKGGGIEIIYSECLKTSSKSAQHMRIKEVGDHIKKVIEKYSPKFLAIEKLFFNTNQKTAMGVSESRGVMIYQCVSENLQFFEFNPLEIKVAITSYGRSNKSQMISMLNKLFPITKSIKEDDEYDAIAVAATLIYSKKSLDIK